MGYVEFLIEKAEELLAKVPYKIYNDDVWTPEQQKYYDDATYFKAIAEILDAKGKWIKGSELNAKKIKPPHYTWHSSSEGIFYSDETYCSHCLHDAYSYETNPELFAYCPYCGTRMINGDEELK